MCDGGHYPTVSYPYRLLGDSEVGIASGNNLIVSARAVLLFAVVYSLL